MEHKTGEIFEYNGEWYQCIKSDSYRCDYCDYGELGNCDDIACGTDERKDGKEVYFKKLEKTGEPYKYFVQHKGIVMLQPYKLFAIPIINGVVCNVHYDTNTIDLEIKQTKEDMEEKKLNLKPFDIQKARKGKPVCTRDGRKARIICFDQKDIAPIVGLVTGLDGKESIYAFYKDGRVSCQKERVDDLMMLPEKKEGWINIYNADTTFYYADGRVFETKDEAVQEAKEEVEKEQREKNEYIDTIRVEWEE